MTSKKNVYVFVGGGSGGHLTPLIPVAEALHKLDENASIIHIGQYGDRLNDIIKRSDAFSDRKTVHAGKFRRYYGESYFKRIVDIKTLFFNVRDFLYFILGIIESWVLLGRIKPQVIFMKGGYVCAPVGIAAGFRHIPYITHDSDAMVSLAHRLIAKKASVHTTAMDPEFYTPKYDSKKTVKVGVPVRAEYQLATPESRNAARRKLSFPETAKVLLVVGGGLGAQNINERVVQGSNELLNDESVHIIHITGQKLFDKVQKSYHKQLLPERLKRVILEPFSNELYTYSAAANVIITRAGATNMAELSAQAAACIIVPNPLLAGGHQLKNAEVYIKNKSAIVVAEKDIQTRLMVEATQLLGNLARQDELRKALHRMSSTDAADRIAEILIKTKNNTSGL